MSTANTGVCAHLSACIMATFLRNGQQKTVRQCPAEVASRGQAICLFSEENLVSFLVEFKCDHLK